MRLTRAAPVDEVERGLRAALRVARRDVEGVARDHQQLGVSDRLLPGSSLLHRRQTALVGGDHERRAGDPGQVGPNIGVVDRGIEADDRRHWSAAHERDPPLDTRGGEPLAETSCHRAPGPVLHAPGLELFGQRRDPLGALAERRRRADHGERHHAFRSTRGEGPSDDPADLRADQMKAPNAERVHEAHVVVDDDVERPLEVARHRRRGPVTAHVRSHDAEASRQRGHPGVPGPAALGVAVQQEHRRGLFPGLGEVVDEVMQMHAGRGLERRHHDPPIPIARCA